MATPKFGSWQQFGSWRRSKAAAVAAGAGVALIIAAVFGGFARGQSSSLPSAAGQRTSVSTVAVAPASASTSTSTATSVLTQTPASIAIETAIGARPTSDARSLAIDRGAVGVWQALLKLHTRASLLMVVAHPDDEDGGMMAYETRGHGARIAQMTLNRGEGGQNVMSDNFYDALGLVRTEELLSADRYYGVQQFWGTEADFGFSKTREETLGLWGYDRVLADVVRVIRITRPLVVTSVFVGGSTDGHGHHSVSGQMAQEAFAAAGDPKMFPEQIREGLRPWSPLKMYARVPFFSVTDKGMFDYATGKWMPVRFYDYITKTWSDGTPTTTLQIPEGNYDPLLGATYVQIAREGWALQKSQNGGGGIPLAGPAETPYHRYASLVTAAEKEQSYFDGVDTSLAGIADLAKGQDNSWLKEGLGRVNTLLERAMSSFSASDTSVIAPTLAEGLKQINAITEQTAHSSLSEQAKYDVLYELKAKQEQFQRAITLALGISLEATVAPKREPARGNFIVNPQETFAFAVPGQEFSVKVHVNNPGGKPLTMSREWLESPANKMWDTAADGSVPGSIAADQALDQRFTVHVPETAAATRPYFTRPNDEQPYYNILDERYRNLSMTPYPLDAWVEFDYEGVPVRMGQVVQTVRQVTGQGTILSPLMVTPAVSVRIPQQAGITPLGSKSFEVPVLVHTEAENGAKGTLHLDVPAGWHTDPATASFALERAGQEENVQFQVFPDRLEQKQYVLTAVAQSGGRDYHEGLITAGYPGLRPTNLFEPAAYRTSGVDVKVAPGIRVGYVTGTGDTVPQSLEKLGVKASFLSAQDLAQGDLQKYDVILLGVRAYAARPELAANNSRLLDYVKNGGVVIVQYNTVQYDHNYGPYPYSLPNDAERVVDENSPVQFVDPQSPVLTWPNKITQKDFSGWVEERGHGFLKTWDSHYVAPIETHDPEEDPQKGGLVYAPYGRGVYVYLAFALYRQLPDGVPGAYRLFANLLSLPRNPAFARR